MNRIDLLKAAENIRKHLCCYLGSPCDCKYGASKDDWKLPKNETTGCCEMREIVGLLTNMTDDDFNNTQKTKQNNGGVINITYDLFEQFCNCKIHKTCMYKDNEEDSLLMCTKENCPLIWM
jgi:hypothetical protein